MRTERLIAATLGAALVLAAAASPARADDSIIKSDDDHPSYRFEAEPHGLLGFGGPFERGRSELGAGFRGTIIVADQGFIHNVNDTVGIGFGGDIFFGHGVFYIPVVMQWNFWLTTHWSVFGEPGIGIAANPEVGRDVFGPVIMLGGRYHFNDRISLTMRLGYPALSVGVSFFL